jgi:hypothetical protein
MTTQSRDRTKFVERHQIWAIRVTPTPYPA